MCFVALEPCKVWQETERKARKSHECSCCHGTIKAGAMYLVHFSVFDGTATSEKMCGPCEADRKEFADAHESLLCSPGWLRRMVRDCMGEGDDDEKWRAMLDRIKARGEG